MLQMQNDRLYKSAPNNNFSTTLRLYLSNPFYKIIGIWKILNVCLSICKV
jgi:hypothetical protein